MNTSSSSYPPILDSPTPPLHALTNCGSAYNFTGSNVPDSKYGPTGDVIQ